MIDFGSNSFSLLWRGSRDGFSAEAFHRRCDGKSNTLTVIKSTTGYIVGGFTSISWSTIGGHKSDPDAFLFSLTNPYNNPVVLKVKKADKAVFHNSNVGPSFGDLTVSNLSNANTRSCYLTGAFESAKKIKTNENSKAFELRYNNLGFDSFFQTVEIEVYQISDLV